MRAGLIVACAAVLLPRCGRLKKPSRREQWEMSLGRRKLTYQRAQLRAGSEAEPRLLEQAVEWIAGAGLSLPGAPYSVVTDRMGGLVTDPARRACTSRLRATQVQVIQRTGKSRMRCWRRSACRGAQKHLRHRFRCGLILSRAQRKICSCNRQPEGRRRLFKRPRESPWTGREQIYVTDTLRDEVFVLHAGQHPEDLGKTRWNGEFNAPTSCGSMAEPDGVDALNFECRHLTAPALPVRDRKIAMAPEPCSDRRAWPPIRRRPLRGDGLWGWCRFSPAGSLCITSFKRNTCRRVSVPAGLYIDHEDQVFVVDSFNRRVQVFHYSV